ncbi:hypothetical protein BHE74_00022435, partial [Ensete ventricosum]
MTFCPIPSLHCAPTTATSVFVPPRILATFDTSPAEKKKKLIGFTPQERYTHDHASQSMTNRFTWVKPVHAYGGVSGRMTDLTQVRWPRSTSLNYKRAPRRKDHGRRGKMQQY